MVLLILTSSHSTAEIYCYSANIVPRGSKEEDGERQTGSPRAAHTYICYSREDGEVPKIKRMKNKPE